MASIKPIEGGSVHKIQSGQVIVDLCSVVKELVENSLDAGATAIDVRFKNHGLESIEVQDNGSGVAREDYETIALKHYTSKLSSYEDLTSLQTFGFRGEAISSLCALSNVHIITAREDEAPKGTRLDFELSGKLQSTQVVASQRGTTVVVETIFKNLPVRRQELEKNIKREYGKVLGLLQAYACITKTARVSASNIMAKGKKAVVFSTKANQTTRENIANVFGSKTLPALISLDLQFDMQASAGRWNTQEEGGGKQVKVIGHVSRPIFGEGRQTPDRQMFFVNGRPCGLPQVAKVFNEVYKSYNLSQSPFIFADVILDTNAYDVNVSPDKRTILLHDQGALLESIRTSLTDLFEKQQHTVPQSLKTPQKLPSFRPLTVSREITTSENLHEPVNLSDGDASDEDAETTEDKSASSLIHKFAVRNAQHRVVQGSENTRHSPGSDGLSTGKQRLVRKTAKANEGKISIDEYEDVHDIAASDVLLRGADTPVLDFNRRMAEQHGPSTEDTDSPPRASPEPEEKIHSITSIPSKPDPGVVPNAFDRMRPCRTPAQTATITIGSKTMITSIGSPILPRVAYNRTPLKQVIRKPPRAAQASSQFSSSMKAFAAPGTQLSEKSAGEDEPSSEETDEELMDENLAQDHHATRESGPDEDHDNVESSDHDEKAGSESDIDVTDGEYLDDETKKMKEDAKVALLIHEAEEKAARPTQDNLKRAEHLLKGGGRKESTSQLLQTLETSVGQINQQVKYFEGSLLPSRTNVAVDTVALDADNSAEERLSLTVSKEDFGRMRIVGQFNLGFIIAVRPATSSLSQSTSSDTPRPSSDELFIIDQHASDEKYNFERLQATTVVQNQRLVHPQTLDLTAIEEEIIIENQAALVKNGFLLSVDESGDVPVGQRCKLLSLPMSREVTFSTRDLEELLVLLGESPPATRPAPHPTNAASSSATTSNQPAAAADWSTSSPVPRPSKVRKMFAMRACRSSVMVGKTLTQEQMGRLVGKMGELEKPWNCPHGRPTMRHLMSLGGWQGWEDGQRGGQDRLACGSDVGDRGNGNVGRWKKWLASQGVENGSDDVEVEQEGDLEAEGQGEDESSAGDSEIAQGAVAESESGAETDDYEEERKPQL
ncbi:ATP-binding mismatch repair protein [Lambiella insularis]|nr:ATP-binding mismatch repair protein [Lambiella insularis]